MYLGEFKIRRPQFSKLQGEALQWLGWIHAQADPSRSVETYQKLLQRFSCSAERIHTRGYEHPLYGLESKEVRETFVDSETVMGLTERMKFYREICEERAEELLPPTLPPPNLLMHVSCTGYTSPSAVQKISLARQWSRTEVLHFYHMGCYASLPACRSAWDFLRARGDGSRVQILHNELCTLHLDPSLHSPEQLVVQSLFADGHITYAAGSELSGSKFEILSFLEKIIPDSAQSMTWDLNNKAFFMTLARDVPEKIQAHVLDFVTELTSKAGYNWDEVRQRAYFAIHPGGPRIIDTLADFLKLEAWQIEHSQKTLRAYGNMSSGTLPHVWSSLLADSMAEPSMKDRPVISLAFGPGLTMFGSCMDLRVAKQD